MHSTNSQFAALSKVPAVTLGFWIIKILATTLGETGGDTVTMTWLGETTREFNVQPFGFKFPLGSGLHIEHPGGRIEEMPYGPNAELSIRSLVRGIYRVNVAGAPGISPISPIDR